MLLSIVSPIYKGEKMIDELVYRIEASVSQISSDYEIILVNDNSPDNSWQKIKDLCIKDKRVKGVELSRNFGQHYAITAGLSFAKGEWVVVMDCDLQDNPDEIPNLFAEAQEGWDIVYARRANRKDKPMKRLSSTIFHSVYDWLSGLHTDKAIANYGIYKKCVIDEFNKMPECSRSFGSLISYLGFRTTAIDVKHSQRLEGKSSYSLTKLLRLSYDVIISNSNKPLMMTVFMGFIMSLLSFLLAIYNIVAKLLGLILVSGYTSTVFSIWFVGGLILFVMGILGLYIGKIFDQVKGRQLFIVRSKLNFD